MKKKYALFLIVLGIVATVAGFFGEISAILRGTLLSQIIFGAIFVFGLLVFIYGIELRK